MPALLMPSMMPMPFAEFNRWFQSYNLIDYMTAVENAGGHIHHGKELPQDRKTVAYNLLDCLGITGPKQIGW